MIVEQEGELDIEVTGDFTTQHVSDNLTGTIDVSESGALFLDAAGNVTLNGSEVSADGTTAADAGDILILGAAMGAILSRLQQVATINEQYQAAIVSARRLHEVLSAPPTIGSWSRAVSITR